MSDFVVEVCAPVSEPTITIAVAAQGARGRSFVWPTFSWSGELEVATGLAPFVAPYDMEIEFVIFSVADGSPPIGDDAIADVNISGSTIFTTQASRPTIADGTSISPFAIPDITFWPQGAPLTIDIDQIGSAFAGAEGTVQIIASAA